MRLRALALLCCMASLGSAQVRANAPVNFDVDIAASSVRLTTNGGRVSLALSVRPGAPVPARVLVSLISPSNATLATGEASVTLSAPRTKVDVTVEGGSITSGWTSKLVQSTRLRYEIIPGAGTPVKGIVALSRFASDALAVTLVSDTLARSGAAHSVHVIVTSLTSHRPLAGVTAVVRLTLDIDPELVIERSCRTDDRGVGVVNFPIPDTKDADDGDIEATVVRGAYTAEASLDLDVMPSLRSMLISTDKSMYQPGQTMHARVLVVGDDRRAASGQVVRIEVEDESGETVLARDLTTSRFGVASFDVPLRDDAPLGNYEITATVDSESDYDDESTARVCVSRYELPTFAVRVAADKPFYLPGDSARVTVTADYLFGRPVPGGRVRVEPFEDEMPDAPGEDDDEDFLATGTSNDEGSFEATIDLSGAWSEIRGYDRRRYYDASYVASVTDPTTNRTERRRFDLRVTYEPIHVRVVGLGRAVRGEPVSFFVTTSLADGTVIPCTVKVSEPIAPVFGPNHQPETTWRTVATVRTNRYGVARVRDARFIGPASSRWGWSELRLEARDSQGRTGSDSDSVSLRDEGMVRVEAARTILPIGGRIEAIASTNSDSSSIVVHVVRDRAILATKVVEVVRGRARIEFPYKLEYQGRLSIVAVDPRVLQRDWDDDEAVGIADVLYPSADDIEVRVRPSRPSYTPGESLTAAVDVRDGRGRRPQSVLAIAAVDMAVGERQASSSSEYLHGGLTMTAPWQRDRYARIGSITVQSLQRLDPTVPARDDLDTVAAALLSENLASNWRFAVSSLESVNQKTAFSSDFYRLRGTLDWMFISEMDSSGSGPADTASLAAALARYHTNFADFTDPWNTTLGVRSTILGSTRRVTVNSAGPDTVHGTADDVMVTEREWKYFEPSGNRIRSAIDAWTASTGRFVRDDISFAEAMRHGRVGPEDFFDAWGRPVAVKFLASGAFFVVRIDTAGEDGIFGGTDSDDFELWRTYTDFFGKQSARIERALETKARLGAFPTDAASWFSALAEGGIEPRSIVDQYGSEPVPSFRNYSRYSNRTTFEERTVFGSTARTMAAVVIPVTEVVDEIVLTGPGQDLRPGTLDDLRLATFTRVRSSMSASSAQPVAEPVQSVLLAGNRGGIAGVVTDPQGAVIAGGTVVLIDSRESVVQSVTSDGEGRYVFRNVAPGMYTVRFDCNGFGSKSVNSVPVYPNITIQLDVELSVSGAGESVDVVAGGEGVIMNTENQTLATTVRRLNLVNLDIKPRQRPAADANRPDGSPLTTPRLRQYFPETVYWNPELVTDARGRARIEFKLADSITTWQVSVLASTEDGRVGFANADVLAFQPFFVEHDPPRVLTEGDRIGLPVVVRNYLDSAQSVDLSISPAAWFSVEGPASRTIRVGAGASSRQVFDVKTIASVDDGPQRVTGLGAQASDAIEKPVDVHPDGQERIATSSALISGTGTLEVRVPEDVLGSPQTKLKIYPGLMAHAVESVEGIMQRPYGCGEQTISSTYPSLLLLRHASDGLSPALEEKATKYLREGYERLKSYRAADGGIGYWTDSPSNTALTAYALRFLLDADGVIDVDDALVAGLRDCLLASQRTDGRWEAARWYSAGDHSRRDAMETAYVAGVLAKLQGVPKFATASTGDSVRRALAFAAPIASRSDEPYLIASIALAALDNGDQAMADDATARLVATAHSEGAKAYWTLETNTPFCGWGVAGRIETTARVVRALARHAQRYPAGATSADARSLVDRGTLFLLGQKDRYGVWYSTQATISVLDAVLEQLGDAPGTSDGKRTASIRVDGREVTSIELPPSTVVSEPLTVSLSSAIGAGDHVVEVVTSDGAKVFAQVVARHYVPWVDAGRDAAKPNRAEKREDALRLAVEYDRLDASVGQPVTCTVTAERIGHRGYGMLVAEIGLPPGNDVDRSSLDRAVAGSGWTVCKYDVLPDRVVAYLWPRAGGASFSFRFTTRYGIEAMAAPSTVYDYYNPESNVVLQPPRFTSAE